MRLPAGRLAPMSTDSVPARASSSKLGRVASRKSLHRLLRTTSTSIFTEKKAKPQRSPSDKARPSMTEQTVRKRVEKTPDAVIPLQRMKASQRSVESLKTMRYRIVKEIRDSERTYVTAMHTVILLFLEPLENAVQAPRKSLTHSSTILSQSAIDSIFSNVRDIACVATDVLQDLEVVCHPANYSRSTMIGKFFLRLLELADFTETYRRYIEDYGERLAVLSGDLPSSFTEFRVKQESSAHCGNHTLSSFLVQPVQRIPRYTLLIRDLLNHTDPEHEDYAYLSEALAAMQQFAASLEVAKKQADDKAELFRQLDNMNAKERAQLGLEERQIIASGPIKFKEDHKSELQTRFLILCNDKLVCCRTSSSKKSAKVSHVYWEASLQNCKISKHLDHIVLSELRSIEEYPYAEEHSRHLYPMAAPPYDLGFWFNNLESAMSTFWFNDGKVMESSSTFAMTMRLKLLTEKDIAVLKIGFPKRAFSPGEVVIEEGRENSTIYYVESGCLRVQKEHAVTGKVQLLTTMEEGEFLGEFAFLKPPGMRSAEATVVASPDAVDPAILCCMDMDALGALFVDNPVLALKFYKLQACVLANRFTLQHFTRFRNDAVICARKQSLATIQDLVAGEFFADSSSDESEAPGAEDELDAFESDWPEEQDNSAEDDSLDSLSGSEAVSEDDSHGGASVHNEPLYPAVRKYSSGRLSASSLFDRRRSSAEAANALARQRFPAIAKAVPAQESVVEEHRVTAKGPGLPDYQKARLLILENYVVLHWKQFLKANVIAVHRSKLASVSVHADSSSTVILATTDFRVFRLDFEHEELASQAERLVKRLVAASADLSPAQLHQSSSWDGEGDRMDLTEDDWQLLMTVGQEQIFPRGTVIIRYRKPLTRLYHVKEGQCLAFIDKGDVADRLRGETVDDGEVVGEITFVQGGVATATVEVQSEVATLVSFERTILFDLLEREPRLGSKFYRLLSLFLAERFLAIQSGMML